MRKGLIVTIDGPSGAGKSTLAKRLAEDLGYRYIDTGAMYRGVAYAYRLEGDGKADLDGFLARLRLTFAFEKVAKVYLDGRDISGEIRDADISLAASRLSKDPRVREKLVGLQRELGEPGGVVLEGRDTGSVVFPHADVKFYLDADPSERARRRFLELRERSDARDLAEVHREMEKRDRDDSMRSIAPLRVPDGALRIDTTGLTIDEVLEIMKKQVRRATK